MSRIAYVNGRYLPIAHAGVSIDDRGFQFADSVYEGVSVRRGRMIDLEPHLDRLWRSMNELEMETPMQRGPMRIVLREVIRKNRITDGFLYLQITRGVARRDHAFPALTPAPGFVVTCRPLDFDAIKKRAIKGVATYSTPDIRWGRCDIKSTSLLPNALAKQFARSHGGFESVMIDQNGYVTEGSSTNIWMVRNGKLVTRSTDDNILSGITRAAVLQIAEKLGLELDTTPYTITDAVAADEMFLTSSTSGVTAISSLDDHQIGAGGAGPITRALIEAYWDMMDKA